jgi:hypothetical protein
VKSGDDKIHLNGICSRVLGTSNDLQKSCK